MTGLEAAQSQFIEKFEGWLRDYLSQCAENVDRAEVLLASQQYSLLSGGKRFRPFLASLVFSLFSDEVSRIRCFGLALEMVHTYSLIHDDLPCMDNDDFRRGKPTNHKVYSEDVALLAGDGLLTDVFALLATDKALSPEARVNVIQMLARRIGSFGMVGGQTLDMKVTSQVTIEDLKRIHTLKTANLIEAAALGAAIYAGATATDLSALQSFGHSLGMAFQIKDDLLDAQDKDQDFKSYVGILGLAETQKQLVAYSEQARQQIQSLKKNSALIEELIDFNLTRSL